MLKKISKLYRHKLQIFQLFEGDMNALLKLLLGKILMRRLIDDGMIIGATYGSIPGQDPLEAIKALQ